MMSQGRGWRQQAAAATVGLMSAAPAPLRKPLTCRSPFWVRRLSRQQRCSEGRCARSLAFRLSAGGRLLVRIVWQQGRSDRPHKESRPAVQKRSTQCPPACKLAGHTTHRQRIVRPLRNHSDRPRSAKPAWQAPGPSHSRTQGTSLSLTPILPTLAPSSAPDSSPRLPAPPQTLPPPPLPPAGWCSCCRC